MGLHHHRKLMPLPEICGSICHVKKLEPCLSDCKVCLKICLTSPQYPSSSYYYSPPTLPPQVPPLHLDDDDGTDQSYNHTISTYLFLALALLTAAFLVVCCRAIYSRFSSSRRSRRVSSTRPQTHHDDDHDFIDEEHGHGHMVDHPIWYIRTIGLQQSIINAITVCKYKKGEGLIEGTDCAVCLSEFQEDENLRLLPKCHHAFHLPCIDTWLRSHTNCPMCRAPIIADLATATIESNFVYPNSLESTHVEVLENSSPDSELVNNRDRVEEQDQLEVEDGVVVRVCETESPVEDVVTIRPRRSFSLDSSSVANFNLALATVESNGNSKRVLGGVDDDPTASKGVIGNDLATTSKGSSSFRLTRYLPAVQGVPNSSVKRSQSFNGKYLLSWYARTQKKPNANAPLRSF